MVGIGWRINETYIKLNGKWVYLYHAADTKGNTIDFMLSETQVRKLY
jgi:transposase-like protein